jgi:GntR family transcriptional regulator
MATKYDRIADDLRQQIRSGKLPPTTRLPTEDELMDQYKVSPGPIQRALAILRAEGLIETRHGVGSSVRQPRHKVQRSPERYQWEKDRVPLSETERFSTGAVEKDTGLEFDHLDFHAAYSAEPADETLAAIFGVQAGTKLLHRSYRTHAKSEDAPISLINSYLVYDLVARNPDLLDPTKEPWPGGTQHQLSTVGIELDRITDHITARPPQSDEAEQLDIGPGVSVFVLRKISIDTRDRVVEVSDVVLPGDRTEFVYTTKLTRWDS